MLEDTQELITLRVDHAHARSVLAHPIDQQHAAEEDREPACRVPRHREDRLIGLERRIRNEPHRRRRGRDNETRPESGPPRDRHDRDEVEEGEAELWSGDEIDDADERYEHEAEQQSTDGTCRCGYLTSAAAGLRGRCFSSIARICSG